MMGLASFLFGKRRRTQQMPTVSPQQSSAMNQILQQALAGLQQQPQQMQSFDFQPIAEQARKQFSEGTIPSLAERFTSLGGGAQRSSAFQSALGRAGSDLDTNLAALQSQYGLEGQKLGLQQRGQLQNLLGLALRPQFENVLSPSSPGLLQSLLSSGIQGVGRTLPAFGYNLLGRL